MCEQRLWFKRVKLASEPWWETGCSGESHPRVPGHEGNSVNTLSHFNLEPSDFTQHQVRPWALAFTHLLIKSVQRPQEAGTAMGPPGQMGKLRSERWSDLPQITQGLSI